MYRNLKDKLEDLSAETTEPVILADREKFRWVYRAIFKWLSKTNDSVILGGEWACRAYDQDDILNSDEVIKSGRQLQLYTTHPQEHSEDLSRVILDYYSSHEEIKKISPESLISSRVSIMNNEYIVAVMTRNFAIFTKINPEQGIDMIKLMQSNKFDLEEYTNISILPADILLAAVYRFLISPEFYGERERWKKLENALYKKFLKTVKQGKFASDSIDLELEEVETVQLSESLNAVVGGLDYFSPEIIEMKKKLLDIYDDPDTTVVGKQIINPTSHLDLLSICVSLSKEDIIDRIGEFKREADEIIWTSTAFRLPNDFRIERIRIKYKNTFQLIDIYNCARYDIILPHPYFYLRLMFVELWSLQVIYRVGGMTENIYENQSEKLINNINIMHSRINNPGEIKLWDNPREYIGYYESDNTAKQRMRRKGAKGKTYYPESKCN